MGRTTDREILYPKEFRRFSLLEQAPACDLPGFEGTGKQGLAPTQGVRFIQARVREKD
jgi:hypothetical protein